MAYHIFRGTPSKPYTVPVKDNYSVLLAQLAPGAVFPEGYSTTLHLYHNIQFPAIMVVFDHLTATVGSYFLIALGIRFCNVYIISFLPTFLIF